VCADCWCHTAGPSRSCYGRLGGRLIECQDLVGREEGHHLFEPGARSILVAPKSEVLYALAAQVVRMQHAA